MLCGVPETLVAFWGALCGSARENSPTSTPYSLRPPLKKSHQNAIFICIYAKIIVSLHPKAQRRGLEGGRCPLSESQTICQIPSHGFQDIFKRRLLTLCSGDLKLRNFHLYAGLSNGRCPTGYRLSLLCLFGTSFAYMRMRTRVS